MDKEIFTFTYTDGDSRSFEMSFEADTWPQAVEQFTSFLGAVFGYSIKDQVALKTSKYRLSDDWSGPVFKDEKEEK